MAGRRPTDRTDSRATLLSSRLAAALVSRLGRSRRLMSTCGRGGEPLSRSGGTCTLPESYTPRDPEGLLSHKALGGANHRDLRGKADDEAEINIDLKPSSVL